MRCYTEAPLASAGDTSGPLQPLAPTARCCARNPRCRHSLRAQNLGLVELTDRGTKRHFAAVARKPAVEVSPVLGPFHAMAHFGGCLK
jgi:hypothetical protein